MTKNRSSKEQGAHLQTNSQRFSEQDFDAVFGDAYKGAYDKIVMDKSARAVAGDLEARMQKRTGVDGMQAMMVIMRPIAAFCVVLVLLSVTALPALARVSPTAYGIVVKYAPGLVEHIVYGENSDTGMGITLQVEAIKTEAIAAAGEFGENRAEIIVSFSDAEGSEKDYIKGKVEMYDSYHLQSYGEHMTVSGCQFLEYDATEDKAYFKIQISTDGSFDKRLLKFSVRQLLTENSEERRDIDISNPVKTPGKKSVKLNGRGGMGNMERFEQYLQSGDEYDPRPGAKVIDFGPLDESLLDDLSVVGVGYENGVLKVQSCRGDLTNADRHVQLFLVDGEGNERHEDYSVDWKEQIGKRKASFTEHWFLVEEAELEKLQMYGSFIVHGGCVEGDWQVLITL